MTENETKRGISGPKSGNPGALYGLTEEEEDRCRQILRGGSALDEDTAEHILRRIQERTEGQYPSAAVRQWTKFLSAGKTGWIPSFIEGGEDSFPALHVVNARLIHAGMGSRTQDMWLDVREKYTVEHIEYLNRISGRGNSPFFGFDTEHPILLVSPIPSGNNPLGQILKKADDYFFGFRWLDGTHFRAIPCIDENGLLLICDQKNMDTVDKERTNAALIEARDAAR